MSKSGTKIHHKAGPKPRRKDHLPHGVGDQPEPGQRVEVKPPPLEVSYEE